MLPEIPGGQKENDQSAEQEDSVWIFQNRSFVWSRQTSEVSAVKGKKARAKTLIPPWNHGAREFWNINNPCQPVVISGWSWDSAFISDTWNTLSHTFDLNAASKLSQCSLWDPTDLKGKWSDMWWTILLISFYKSTFAAFLTTEMNKNKCGLLIWRCESQTMVPFQSH